MRRLAAVLLVGAGCLLLPAGAPGVPDVPGDPTPPVVTPIVAGTLGDLGWYTSNVNVNWSVTDPESTILSTSGCNAITMTADTTGMQLTCTAESDGGITTVSKAFKIDKTAPAATASASRAADSNGWYNHSLTVSFSATDGTSGVASCAAPQTYAGPDTAGTSVAGTCRDVAGNTGAASLPVKYDATAPTASPSARAPDANGWFNHAVTVTFQGTDATSGVNTCTQQTYAGPDDPSVALGGTCSDRAGNVSGSAVYSLKYDETAPAATATASRPADVNGWYNHSLTVSFAGSDVTSGLDSCDATKSYAGPDSAGASVAGACRDLAGNVASRTVLLRYDGTAPQVTATPGRAANADGWYNAPLSVTFAGTDPMSGVASCAGPQTYSGPDSGAASVSGSCADQAGNSGGSSFALKYDATAPQATASPGRPADANGWYNHGLTVSFAGTDGTSGIASCDAAKTYSSPDTAGASLAGTCRDRAGNTSSSAAFGFKYDATAPVVSAAPSRQPNGNGWYRAPLTVAFSGGDATSGVQSCDAEKSYAGPDSSAAAVGGSCRDFAGNAGTASFALRYDASAPLASATPSRAPNVNGWYNAPLTVSFGAADATSGLDSCPAAQTYSGPDSGSAAISGTCLDRAGNSAVASLPVRYDATPPQTSATASRAPAPTGWYTAPLTVGFSATDATSTVDSCDPARSYAGPDVASTTVTGSCRDKAGNAASAGVQLKYDATPPQASATPSRQPNAAGWYNAPLSIGYTATDATSGLDSCPSATTYAGPDTVAGVVSGTCLDKAGNGTLASLALKYDATVPLASATPDRGPNANGWYRAALTVGFAGTDVTSGIASCDAAKTYSTPDSASASLGGTCLDRAGNQSASAVFGFKYDATAPSSSATPSRQPNANGWYRAPLTVGFGAIDALSGLDSCDAAKAYSGPDSGSASVSGDCRDKAGNVGTAAYALRYDATAPLATASPSRQPNGNGWYNAPLSVNYAATDALSGPDSCDTARSYSGPDTASASLPGTCSDKAGNAATAAFSLRYDATAPIAAATPSRPANANGWYNAALSVHFDVTDVTSGLGSCPADQTYSGPDSGSVSVSGTCLDQAGNSATATFALRYDATAPTTTATPARPPNAKGWYNAPVAVAFSATDATSTVESCDAQKAYSGPDVASTVITGNCRDKAGNSGPGSIAIKYDATGPQAIATPSRQPNAAGWYNAPLSVTFSATDATSGVDSCPAAQSYTGPDSALGVVSGTCLDNAGNATTASAALKYDGTAPSAAGVASRAADANGWYNHAVTVAFQGSDLTSGIDACTAPQTYAGPDTAAVSLSGSCRDRAGNDSGAAQTSLKYDATLPQVASATAVRGPDRAGWYNRPVAFAVQGSDAMSGIDACPAVTYSGPDGAAAAVAAACIDRAGNQATRLFPLQYDGTGPRSTATPDRGPDANGWYNHAVTIGFAGEDSVSGLESCDQPERYEGPDSALVVVGGVCIDKAGNVGLASLALSYDTTAPEVTGAAASRPPDANGWYNHALGVAFHGSDVTSGVDACTQLSYAGPDAAATSVSGSCRDRAGNASGSLSFPLRYDSTAPTLRDISAKAGNGTAALSWKASPDTTLVEIRRGRALVYRGVGTSFTDRGLKNGTRYRYALTAYDEAGNSSSGAVRATPMGPLVAPAAGAVVTRPPRLAWRAVERATYYNVQLWRKGRILSEWPRRTSLQLRRSWTYQGHRYHLTKGTYRWYVFPGYGRRAEKRFGKLLGSSSFVVR